ncbi:MAG TPA: MerR family transcriptional regulator [Kiloniellales bacterium]
MTTNHSEPTNHSGAGSRSGLKSAAAFRTISEVAQELEVPQHVLRFWESKFTPVRPLKRGGGRRYYRPEDVDLLRRIRTLLYSDGYTIKGVQKLLREGQGKLNAAVAGPPIAMERRDLRVIVEELSELRDILRKAVR